MSQVHRRILNAALAGLEEEPAAYFADVADKLGEDPRTDRMPNMVYLVLADTVRYLPIYLSKKELIGLLFRFVNANYGRLRGVIYDPRFIEDKSLLTPITGDFVAEVVEATLAHYDNGELESGERVVHRLSFDGDGGVLNFPYVDDEAEDD